MSARRKKTAPGAEDPAIGTRMPDGTIYAGISPDTHKPMYAAPADTGVMMTFNEAAKYAKDLVAGGNHDFRVPSKSELDVLLKNRDKGALKGTFNTTGSSQAGYYLSSTPFMSVAVWTRRSTPRGSTSEVRSKRVPLSLRCVR